MGFEITKETYAGAIKGITIGKGDTALTVGGQTSYPFYRVNPWKNRTTSVLLYKSNRPQVSMVSDSLINHLECW